MLPAPLSTYRHCAF